MLTTVQDLGRVGHTALGVARAGAADALSLRVGNRLVGNDDGAAALEFTLLGGALRCEDDDVIVALAGAPLAATIEERDGSERALPRYVATALSAGCTLRLRGTAWGVRAYLCVRGGIDVPLVLGSRATHVASQLGGHAGRALRAGDRARVAGARGRAHARTLTPKIAAELDGMLRQPTLRATDAAHAAAFTDDARAEFWRGQFTVTDRCDRAGIRLHGPLLASPNQGVMRSEGLPRGAIEISGDGEAIVLLSDGPPTGGYPTPACVASVDHPRLGQLRPRETIGLQRVSLDEARSLFAAREAWLGRAVPPP